MQDQNIICPTCKSSIPLTEAITLQIREQIQKELGADFEHKLKDLTKKEQGVSAKLKLLDEREEKLAVEVDRRVQSEKEQLKKAVTAKAKEEYSLQVKDLEEQLKDKEQKLTQAQTTELQLRKKSREIEEKEKNLDLELERKLEEARKQIVVDATKTVEAQFELRIADKDKRLSEAIAANKELERKLQQGSQQTQGEVLELKLEDLLRAQFPLDVIEPVGKGIRGGDILQKVNNGLGLHCGMIIWETKRTKGWNDTWLEKIKDDQRAAKADLAIIVATTVPENLKNFNRIDGVWVTEYSCAISLVTALRMSLIEISNARAAATGKNDKIELLYNYLSGPQFKQRVEGIVESFKAMRNDLEQERRAMTRIWARREKQIERMMLNTSGLYGDMEGIIGSTLPAIEDLDLKTLEGQTHDTLEDHVTQQDATSSPTDDISF